MNQISKAVVSRQGGALLRTASTPAAHGNAGDWVYVYVARGELSGKVAALKASAGNPIIAHGVARFPGRLVAQGLVDIQPLVGSVGDLG